MGTYRWVHHDGEKLLEVGILADGTLRNPNGYPEDVVRAAVLAADARRHERRSRSAKKAATTRQRRRDEKIQHIAKRLLSGAGIFGVDKHCRICGRGLDDRESIRRGIGSECWQDVLSAVEALRRSSTQAPSLPAA